MKGSIGFLFTILFATTLIVIGCNSKDTMPTPEMSQAVCESAKGYWNECGNRCQLDNQGKDVACTLQCEQLCECGGESGYLCPEGYACKINTPGEDALGYCIALGNK